MAEIMDNNGDIEMKEEVSNGGAGEGTMTPEEYAEAATLLNHGISQIVAKVLLDIYKTGKLSQSELDDRAMDALKEFAPDDAKKILKQFSMSNLDHVNNKSAFLCGQMKSYRHKLKSGKTPADVKGPDEEKLKEILDRTGYSLDVTTGQRKYGGPPPGMDPTPPGPGHEVFCGKVPKDCFEDELIPLFEKCGTIWDMRLMMDPLTGLGRGYGFVTFCEKDAVVEAVAQLHNYEIRPDWKIQVNKTVAKVRLFVGNLPKSKSKEEIMEEFGKRTDGLQDVIVYGTPDNPKQKNRGFAFLDYETHKHASNAKRKMQEGHHKFWKCDVIVDWADPVEDPDEDVMAKVKVLYVKNLTSDVTEEILKEKFSEYGKVERVKKIKDYGFIHFEERDDALNALDNLNGQQIGSATEVDISLAKPPSSDNKRKEQKRRDQDMRMMKSMMRMSMRGGMRDHPYMPRGGARGARGGGRGGRGAGPRRPPYGADPYDDYYGGYDTYDDYGYGMPPAGPMRGRRGMPPGAGYEAYRWGPPSSWGASRRSWDGGW